MPTRAIQYLWRRVIQRASGAVLRRKECNADARLGREGEEAAYWHLRKLGFVMVERNYRPQGLRGEIDLIGWEGNTLVFVEVKTRRSAEIVAPEAAVDREKERNVMAAARQYRMRSTRLSEAYRFDIVSIIFSNGANRQGLKAKMEIQHFRDCFRETAPPS